jgi:hypothetical protein
VKKAVVARYSAWKKRLEPRSTPNARREKDILMNGSLPVGKIERAIEGFPF